MPMTSKVAYLLTYFSFSCMLGNLHMWHIMWGLSQRRLYFRYGSFSGHSDLFLSWAEPNVMITKKKKHEFGICANVKEYIPLIMPKLHGSVVD